MIASFIFSGWTLTHQGDVPGGRHFIKSIGTFMSPTLKDRTNLSVGCLVIGLNDFEGIINYRYHFEGEEKIFPTSKKLLTSMGISV